MVKKTDITHALVVNTIIVAVGSREDMFKKRKRLKDESKYSQVYLFPNGIIGDNLGY